jgi:hypothetical protein
MHRDLYTCATHSLELFKVLPTNVTLEDSGTLNLDTAPIEFEIKGQGYEYLYLS